MGGGEVWGQNGRRGNGGEGGEVPLRGQLFGGENGTSPSAAAPLHMVVEKKPVGRQNAPSAIITQVEEEPHDTDEEEDMEDDDYYQVGK